MHCSRVFMHIRHTNTPISSWSLELPGGQSTTLAKLTYCHYAGSATFWKDREVHLCEMCLKIHFAVHPLHQLQVCITISRQPTQQSVTLTSLRCITVPKQMSALSLFTDKSMIWCKMTNTLLHEISIIPSRCLHFFIYLWHIYLFFTYFPIFQMIHPNNNGKLSQFFTPKFWILLSSPAEVLLHMSIKYYKAKATCPVLPPSPSPDFPLH